MPQYLLAGYLPDDFDPSAQDEATVEAIHALNRNDRCWYQEVRLRPGQSNVTDLSEAFIR